MSLNHYWRSTQFPSLDFTTNIAMKGCVVDCAFCPQRTLEKAYTSDIRYLTFDNFKRMVDKLPVEVRVTIAGFTEGWLNKNATDMLYYAHSRGHPVCAFTTAVGMKPDDVERLKDLPFAGNPNGGFCLHLPDEDRLAKHPITPNFIAVMELFHKYQHQIRNFYTMCMSDRVHSSVSHLFPTAHVPEFWNRAGTLTEEAPSKLDYPLIKGRFKGVVPATTDKTCGCLEGLYHNSVLPNGDVSLCCQDYGLKTIIGNLFDQEYDEIMPKPKACFLICRKCEMGINP